MIKKIIVCILCAALLAGFAGLTFYRKTLQYKTDEMTGKTEQVSNLEAERNNLEIRLQELETAENSEEPAGEVKTVVYPVTICFYNLNSSLYSEVYPALKKAGTKGVIIFRDNELPGDGTGQPDPDEFQEMIDAGWSFAISVDRGEKETTEHWCTKIQTYMQDMIYRTGITPDTLCMFEDDLTEGDAQYVAELGITRLLAAERTALENISSLKVIRMHPYGSSDPVADLKQQGSGFAALCVSLDPDSSQDASYQYSSDTLNAVLSNDRLTIQPMVGLSSITASIQADADLEAADAQVSEKETEITEIENRIDEINTKLNELYNR